VLAAWVHCLMKADTSGSRGIEMRDRLPPRPVSWNANMINRLKDLVEVTPGTTRYNDYYDVETLGGTYWVAFATAIFVEHCLETAGPLERIEFSDVFGVLHSVPALYIHRITEGTGLGVGMGLGVSAGLSGVGLGLGQGAGR
jgi:hypothetical protein